MSYVSWDQLLKKATHVYSKEINKGHEIFFDILIIILILKHCSIVPDNCCVGDG